MASSQPSPAPRRKAEARARAVRELRQLDAFLADWQARIPAARDSVVRLLDMVDPDKSERQSEGDSDGEAAST